MTREEMKKKLEQLIADAAIISACYGSDSAEYDACIDWISDLERRLKEPETE